MDFFVVGTSRTGSTLLRNMLDLHATVGVLNESHWVPTMLERWGHNVALVDDLVEIVEETHWDSGRPVVDVTLELTGRSWEQSAADLRKKLPRCSRVDEFHDALFDTVYGVEPGFLRRGDKTPDYGFYMADLQDVWPASRFVHVVRDGVAAARSMRRHPGCRKMIAAGFDTWVPLSYRRRFADLPDVQPSFSTVFQSWRRRMERIRREARSLKAGSYLEIRYEELLASPSLVLRRIAEFLGLAADDSWIERSLALVRPARPQAELSREEREGLCPDDLDAIGVRGPLVGARVASCQGETLVQLDSNRLPDGRDGIWVFSCVRDEMLRLPDFVRHYRCLGANRFFLIDNGSSDGTHRWLVEQPDVHVFAASSSYAASYYGVHWLNGLLAEYGVGGWVLVADADELLVYPDCEVLSLPRFVKRLESQNADALLTFLLDMYPPGPLRDARYEPGDGLLEAAPYFDVDSYSHGDYRGFASVPLRGGARSRLFWQTGRDYRGKPPFLPKVPLVRWRRGLAYRASTHLLDGVTCASTTGALLHFKLLADFCGRARREVERGEHWDEAAQYAVYAETLSSCPDLDPIYEGSVRYQGSEQLVELGLMVRGGQSSD